MTPMRRYRQPEPPPRSAPLLVGRILLWIAVSVTAILFALLHLPQLWGSWAGVVLIFVVGYVLSYVRLRANSLIPSFIIHTSYNAMLFGVFALSTFVQKGAH